MKKELLSPVESKELKVGERPGLRPVAGSRKQASTQAHLAVND